MNRSITRLIGIALLAAFLSACGTTASIQLASLPTQPPTETAVPLVTPTLAPASTPSDLPDVNWSDVTVYKQDMKTGFETDVDPMVDSNRYLIIARLTFEPDAVIRGAERVRYTNHSSDTLDQIVYRLYPNMPGLGGRMNVTHATVNGTAVQPTLSVLDSVMTVLLQSPLAPGASVEMTLDFNVVMAKGFDASFGRFGYIHDVVSGSAWYPTLSVYEQGRGWWQTLNTHLSTSDPAYTEVGLYDVRLTTDADLTVAMSGKEIESTNNPDGTITHRYVTGPMRDNAFMASKRYGVKSVEVDGTKISVYYYADQANKPADGTADALRFAQQAIHFYNTIYGDYPYREYDVTENAAEGGVEYPGLVQIGEAFWKSGNSFLETVVAHETGHQWFYAMVGNNQVEHPWIDESLTAYTEFVYMRGVYTTGSKASDYVANVQREYTTYIGLGQPDQLLDLPVDNFSGTAYEMIIYVKGPLFLLELEHELGRDTLYKALSEYFHRYKYKVAFTPDVEKTFEDVSGKDLSAVFHKWVGP